MDRLNEMAVVLDAIFIRLARIDRHFTDFQHRLEIRMSQLDDLVSKVQEESSIVDSVVTLIQGLRDQIAAAAGDPAKIQAALDELDRQKSKLAAAVQVNVDPSPAPADNETPVDPATPPDPGDENTPLP